MDCTASASRPPQPVVISPFGTDVGDDRPAQALRDLHEALTLIERLQQPADVAKTRANVAWTEVRLGHPADALAAAERAVEIARRRARYFAKRAAVSSASRTTRCIFSQLILSTVSEGSWYPGCQPPKSQRSGTPATRKGKWSQR